MAQESALEKEVTVTGTSEVIKARYEHISGTLTITDQAGQDPRTRSSPLGIAKERYAKITELIIWAESAKAALEAPVV